MNEVVVVSGKGGTGKTSVTASFAMLARQAILADCDVDAANLHLLLAPQVRQQQTFVGGHEAVIRQADCLRCGACLAWCRYGAVHREGGGAGEATFTIDPLACEGCGVCYDHCPASAIDFPARLAGEWMVSDTRGGPLVHARLTPGGENSGKLVSIVREAARRLADEHHRDLILVDGPPGLGCPVIAAVTGASLVLAVTEPTPAGEHDLDRVLALTRHFGVPAALCVNKWDLSPAITERVEQAALAAGVRLVGRIPYSSDVTAAQRQALAVVETPSPVADAMREVWQRLGLEQE